MQICCQIYLTLPSQIAGHECEYDYENRIVRITKYSIIAEFAYDALGRRVEKKDLVDANNTRRYYYNNNWQVLCEADSDGVIQRSFVYGNYIDEVLIMRTGSTLFDIYYYRHDHLHSPVALTEVTGYDVLERYEYDAYGDCNILEDDYSRDADQKSDYENPYLFTGRRVDILDNGSLKIQYNRNRYYDYYTGRWLTHDPLGITPDRIPLFNPIFEYKDSLSLYEYGVSNPCVTIDPYGLCNYGDSENLSYTITLSNSIPTIPIGAFIYIDASLNANISIEYKAECKMCSLSACITDWEESLTIEGSGEGQISVTGGRKSKEFKIKSFVASGWLGIRGTGGASFAFSGSGSRPACSEQNLVVTACANFNPHAEISGGGELTVKRKTKRGDLEFFKAGATVSGKVSGECIICVECISGGSCSISKLECSGWDLFAEAEVCLGLCKTFKIY